VALARPVAGRILTAKRSLESRADEDHFLEFEQPIAELEQRIEELRYVATIRGRHLGGDPAAHQAQQTLTKDIYGKLTPWQVAQVARHAQRPYTLDYVQMLFTHFEELHGDRTFAEDASIVGGLARFGNAPCVVIGHRKAAIPRRRSCATSACQAEATARRCA